MIKKFENFSLPTPEMIDWYEMETRNIDETYDELELDDEYSKIQRDFLETFSEELKGLSYDEKIQIYMKFY